MLVFGGILDVTKELDDMLLYDLDRRRWTHLFEELMLSPIRQKYGSLLLKHGHGSDDEQQYSLTAREEEHPTHENEETMSKAKMSVTNLGQLSPR